MPIMAATRHSTGGAGAYRGRLRRARPDRQEGPAWLPPVTADAEEAGHPADAARALRSHDAHRELISHLWGAVGRLLPSLHAPLSLVGPR
jgi:hypothetical protein